MRGDSFLTIIAELMYLFSWRNIQTKPSKLTGYNTYTLLTIVKNLLGFV